MRTVVTEVIPARADDILEFKLPVPMWIAKVNKQAFNKLALKRNCSPVLTHAGRSLGETNQVPLDAHPVDSGYILL